MLKMFPKITPKHTLSVRLTVFLFEIFLVKIFYMKVFLKE